MAKTKVLRETAKWRRSGVSVKGKFVSKRKLTKAKIEKAIIVHRIEICSYQQPYQ